MPANDALLGAFGGTVFTGLVAIVGNALKNARDRERNANDADGGLRAVTLTAYKEALEEARERRAELAHALADVATERTARFKEMEGRLRAEAHVESCERKVIELQQSLEAIEERRVAREAPPVQRPPSGAGPRFTDEDP